MIRIFEFLLHGCWHSWGEPTGTPVHHHWEGPDTYMYTTRTCRCTKCGRFKAVKVVA
jgi:hypothetical protein